MNPRVFLQDRSEEELKTWLTHGFRTGDWTPVVFADLRSSVPVQIQDAFESLPAAAQERLRGAVIRAIGEWSPAHPELLDSLCVVAAFIKATRAAPLLKTLVTTKLSERCDDPRFARVTATVIATLVGFAPLPDASDAVETLYFNEHVPARFAAQLLNGMVRTDPKNCYRYLPRFVRTAFNNPGLFRMDVVLGRLVDQVSPDVLRENRNRMDADSQHLFTLLLAEGRIVIDPRGEVTVTESAEEAVQKVNMALVHKVMHLELTDLFAEPN